jgi:hypothetical protein
MASAMHENDGRPALNRCEWHETLNAHAMNPVLRLIHTKPRLMMSVTANNPTVRACSKIRSVEPDCFRKRAFSTQMGKVVYR